MVDDPGARVPPPDHLLASLESLNDRIGRGMGRRIEASGLRLRGSEGRILNLVSPDGTRPTALAEGAWITKQAIGKRIRDLEARGLVRLTPDPTDARAVLVHLTPAGERARATIVDQIADLEGEFAAQVGSRRYRQFREVLDDLGRGPAPPG